MVGSSDRKQQKQFQRHQRFFRPKGVRRSTTGKFKFKPIRQPRPNFLEEVEFLLLTKTNLSKTEIETESLDWVFGFVEYIREQEVLNYEQKIHDYLINLNIAVAPHTKDGGQKIGKNLEKMLYTNREIDTEADFEIDEAELRNFATMLKSK
jgi:hypothetical protein